MKASRLLGVVAASLFVCQGVSAVRGLAGPASAQPPSGVVPPGTVALSGLDGQTRTLSIAELDAMPRVSVSVAQHDQRHTYEGALLTDVLKAVGAPSGKALRGADLVDVVLIEARDGYRVAIDLADTDAVTRHDRVILADRVDGVPLAAEQGPFQVIVEGDLRPARSARMVSAIALKRVQ